MQHLNLETLARLVDESPTEEERRHLASCTRCATRLGELRSQTEALGALPSLRPPPDDWGALKARLEAEGLLHHVSFDKERGGPRRGGWLGTAAAVVFFLAGWVSGAALSSPSDGEGPGNLASQEASGGIETPEAAAQVLREAEDRYLEALVEYRSLTGAGDETTSGEDLPARFAALETLVAAGQVAVRRAPTDPFLNGVLVSAMAERQDALRRISSSTPHDWF